MKGPIPGFVEGLVQFLMGFFIHVNDHDPTGLDIRLGRQGQIETPIVAGASEISAERRTQVRQDSPSDQNHEETHAAGQPLPLECPHFAHI